jgi:heme/copper-type cytochrome/quinol oxidase subunit 1
MKRFHIIGRLAVILAGLAGVALAFSAGAAPAALAGGDPHGHPRRAEPPGWYKHPPLPAHTHTAVTGGMPGWQIALIVAGAALLAAALAVTVYVARKARRRMTARPELVGQARSQLVSRSP